MASTVAELPEPDPPSPLSPVSTTPSTPQMHLDLTRRSSFSSDESSIDQHDFFCKPFRGFHRPRLPRLRSTGQLRAFKTPAWAVRTESNASIDSIWRRVLRKPSVVGSDASTPTSNAPNSPFKPISRPLESLTLHSTAPHHTLVHDQENPETSRPGSDRRPSDASGATHSTAASTTSTSHALTASTSSIGVAHTRSTSATSTPSVQVPVSPTFCHTPVVPNLSSPDLLESAPPSRPRSAATERSFRSVFSAPTPPPQRPIPAVPDAIPRARARARACTAGGAIRTPTPASPTSVSHFGAVMPRDSTPASPTLPRSSAGTPRSSRPGSPTSPASAAFPRASTHSILSANSRSATNLRSSAANSSSTATPRSPTLWSPWPAPTPSPPPHLVPSPASRQRANTARSVRLFPSSSTVPSDIPIVPCRRLSLVRDAADPTPHLRLQAAPASRMLGSHRTRSDPDRRLGSRSGQTSKDLNLSGYEDSNLGRSHAGTARLPQSPSSSRASSRPMSPTSPRLQRPTIPSRQGSLQKGLDRQSIQRSQSEGAQQVLRRQTSRDHVLSPRTRARIDAAAAATAIADYYDDDEAGALTADESISSSLAAGQKTLTVDSTARNDTISGRDSPVIPGHETLYPAAIGSASPLHTVNGTAPLHAAPTSTLREWDVATYALRYEDTSWRGEPFRTRAAAELRGHRQW